MRIIKAIRALHKGPICQKAPYMAGLEDKRGFQSAHKRMVIVGPVSFEMALVAIDVVEMVQKVIELASRRLIEFGVRLRSARQLVLCARVFCTPIGHRRDPRFADRAPALPQGSRRRTRTAEKSTQER